MDKVNLQTLNHGAMIDLFDVELEKILKNIEDENTDPKAVRSITIKIDFKPNEERRYASTQLQISSKLASIKPSKSLVFLEHTDGELAAYEDNPKQELLDFSERKVGFGG